MEFLKSNSGTLICYMDLSKISSTHSNMGNPLILTWKYKLLQSILLAEFKNRYVNAYRPVASLV